MPNIVQLSKRVTSDLGDLIAGRFDVMPDPDPRIYGGSGLGGPGAGRGMRFFDEYFQSVTVPTKRVAEMQFYDTLEMEIPDVRKALDVFATLAVTGNLAGGGKATYTIKMARDDYPEGLKARLKSTEKMIGRQAFATIRGMCQYGSYLPAPVIDKKDDGKLGVLRLEHVPPGTIFRNVIKGRAPDPQKYWIQVIGGKVVGGSDQQWNGDGQSNGIPQWMLPHFAIWSKVVSATEKLLYGTSLIRPFGAIGLKMHSVLDSLVVARLSRAAMRYKWKVDVSDIKGDQRKIRNRMEAWKAAESRSMNLLNTAVNTDAYQRAAIPDEDLFVPAAEGLAWDLDTITGDTNLSRVGDIELLARFYFGALGIPPEYLGHERSQGGRSNLSQIDIHLARTIRHLQLFGAAGFEHVVMMDMLLGGWDPREYPVEVLPPPIGARDDLLQAQIRQLQSTVLTNLRSAGFALEIDPRWVLETFLNMDEEIEDLDDSKIAKLIQKIDPESSGGDPAPAGAKKRIQEVLSSMNGQMMQFIRTNVRLMMVNECASMDSSDIYRNGQPNVEQLAAAISRHLEALI